MSSRLITAMDIALRDKRAGVAAWLRWKAASLQNSGKLNVIWDGRTVSGPAVEAIVNRSRWVAICPNCKNVEYVDPETPIFYCLSCGNGNETAARPVNFPERREEIEAILLRRPVLEGLGATRIEILLKARAAFADLPRSWEPGVTIEMLEAQNRTRGV